VGDENGRGFGFWVIEGLDSKDLFQKGLGKFLNFLTGSWFQVRPRFSLGIKVLRKTFIRKFLFNILDYFP